MKKIEYIDNGRLESISESGRLGFFDGGKVYLEDNKILNVIIKKHRERDSDGNTIGNSYTVELANEEGTTKITNDYPIEYKNIKKIVIELSLQL